MCATTNLLQVRLEFYLPFKNVPGPDFNICFQKIVIMKARSISLSLNLQQCIVSDVSGLEIATNTVANATSFFSLATKIFVQSPLWRPEFCMVLKYNKA